MKTPHLNLLLLILAALAGLFSAAFFLFKNNSEVLQNDGKINVMCTTSLIFDAVRRVGGDKVLCKSLMGPGVDPHLYRAREGDIHALIAADLIFYNGLHLEGKMADLLGKMGTWVRVVAVADCLEPSLLRRSEFEGMYDPHIWHDVLLWREVVLYIGAQLAQFAPEHADYFGARATTYAHELEALDAEIRSLIAQIPPSRRILVTAHDAFGYFGAAYGFEVVGLQGMSTDSEIGTKDMQDLVAFLVARSVPVIFIESSIAPRAISAVQEACAFRGWPIKIGEELYSDALSDSAGPAATYEQMMKHNVQALCEGLTS